MVRTKKFYALMASASLLLMGPLHAQDSAPTAAAGAQALVPTDIAGGRAFAPAYFAQYAPQNALDMVSRVPGFSIEGANNKRGLGQGGANVLLNGERFSSKTTDIFTALSQISAPDVIRIELVDAASLDIPGLSGQVVNLVYKVGAGSGQFRWSPEFRTRGTIPQLLDGEISYSGRLGTVDYTLSLANRNYHQGNDGPERVYDGNGFLIEQRSEQLRVEGDRPKISARFKHQDASANIANLNLAFERPRQTVTEGSDRPRSFRSYYETEREYNYEASGDYDFALGGGRLKLIALHRFEHSPFFYDLRTDLADGQASTGTIQNLFIDETESIGRAEYRWKGGANDWQVSLEGALNGLDTDTTLAILQPDGSYSPFDLPGAAATVTEQRAETNLSWGRPLAANLTAQASLGGEYSRISQSGPRGLTRSFLRPKGFLSLAWKTSPTLDVRLRIEREVGQLNFFDFVAQTDIGSGNDNAGNPDLVPQQSWNFELEATKTLGLWGSVTLMGDYRRISDIVGQVPVGEFGEAPGNIDLAIAYGLRATGTVKFDPLGWRGAQLEFEGRVRHARLDDPLTGEPIPVSGNLKYLLDLGLRQDIPASNWAYGGGYNAYEEEPGFRLDQISQNTTARGEAYLFVENKDIFGLKIRATASNLLNTGDDYRRTVFARRRGGPIAFTEARERTFGRIFSLDISGTF